MGPRRNGLLHKAPGPMGNQAHSWRDAQEGIFPFPGGLARAA